MEKALAAIERMKAQGIIKDYALRIFAAKGKFHKAMAKMPIMEKLKIVAALQRLDYSIKPAKWKKLMMWGLDQGL